MNHAVRLFKNWDGYSKRIAAAILGSNFLPFFSFPTGISVPVDSVHENTGAAASNGPLPAAGFLHFGEQEEHQKVRKVEIGLCSSFSSFLGFWGGENVFILSNSLTV